MIANGIIGEAHMQFITQTELPMADVHEAHVGSRICLERKKSVHLKLMIHNILEIQVCIQVSHSSHAWHYA